MALEKSVLYVFTLLISFKKAGLKATSKEAISLMIWAGEGMFATAKSNLNLVSSSAVTAPVSTCAGAEVVSVVDFVSSVLFPPQEAITNRLMPLKINIDFFIQNN